MGNELPVIVHNIISPVSGVGSVCVCVCVCVCVRGGRGGG